MAITFITTTSYGSWLPGDLRGYVESGVVLPGNPRLLQFAKSSLSKEPVLFSLHQQSILFESLTAASSEFGYELSDVSIESWHLHWIISHGDDSASVMVGRLKNRMRQALGRGRIWTKSYWGELIDDECALERAQEYIARHAGCRMSAGRIMERDRLLRK